MKNTTPFIAMLMVCFFIGKHLQAQQAPTLAWQHSYGGSQDDEVRGMEMTADGGFITIGIARSNDGDLHFNNGNADFWIVKYDASGNITWQDVAGGSKADWGRSISKTSDGGYITCGYTLSSDGNVVGNHGDYDYWIVKIDSVGTIQWKKCYGGSAFDNCYRVIQTSDKNYLAVGFTQSNDGQVTGFHGGQDYWILKLDSVGNILWTKTMGGSGNEQAACCIETSDHNYVIVGYSDSYDGDITDHKQLQDVWVVKMNNNGNILWKKSYGGGADDGARWIIQAKDGGYIISGYSASNNLDCDYNHGNYDYWIMKITSGGTIVWEKSLGGSKYDYSYNLTQDLDGNYLVAGYTFSDDGDVTGSLGGSDYWIVKVDTLGHMMWEKIFGGDVFDECRSIGVKSNGDYILAGFTDSNDDNVTYNHGGSDAWIVGACTTTQTIYADDDSDGYGNPNISVIGCSNTPGYSTNNLDCNDSDSHIHPGAVETCNNLDDDCNTLVDDNIAPPSVTVSGNTTFCAGGTVTLTANNFSNTATLQWYQNSSIISGATTSVYNATTTGSYYFVSTTQYCVATSNTIVVTVNALPTATITNGTTVNSCKGSNVTLTATTCSGCSYQWIKNSVNINNATSSTYTYSSNSSANFTVKVTSSAGCSATSSTCAVTKIAKPSATITPIGSLDICTTAQVTLQANSGDGYTYKWYKNDVKISGATGQTYTATSIGSYKVKVTNSNNCTGTSAVTNVYTTCRLGEEPESETMQIFATPNPSDGNFTLNLFTSEESTNLSATVFDLLGKEVMKQQLSFTKGETTATFILPSTCTNGIYLLKMETANQERIIQLVVEK